MSEISKRGLGLGLQLTEPIREAADRVVAQIESIIDRFATATAS
jgi:hypothetical protein